MGEGNCVLGMYDVRGIQNYIFRTPKLKHAIGASAIVESIIEDSLAYAVKQCKDITAELEWEKREYKDDENKDVHVLYIGGGNAFVQFKNKDLYLVITKKMSRYVLEKTYSLQLAAAYILKTGNYQNDYRDLNRRMTQVKADMPESKPLGALPIVETEFTTGLPLVDADVSRETELKLDAEKEKRKLIKRSSKKFDNFIEEKGEDSTLAVIHIDGNNMGLRIRELIENKQTYSEAVNAMRNISYNINHTYKDVFEKMRDLFNLNDQYVVLPVLTAGDDITYVCNGKAAIASVEYFVKEIKKYSMTGKTEDIDKYGFSVCAGIAFIRSHFPFSIGYKVAEACCDSAKTRAKKNLRKNNMVGNFFDFQICQNVQTMDIDNIRSQEYITPTNEILYKRPYEIDEDKPNTDDDQSNKKDNELKKLYSYKTLKSYLETFANFKDFDKESSSDKNMPRSHAKTLRNTYPLGGYQVDNFRSFLVSRGWELPGGGYEVYEDVIIENQDGKTPERYAKYYDALELMDVYVDLDHIVEEMQETVNEEV